MKTLSDPRGNRLLGALPNAQWRRWLPHLEHAETALGHVIYESGGTLNHAYFPTTAMVSILYVMKDTDSAEIAVNGTFGASEFPKAARPALGN